MVKLQNALAISLLAVSFLLALPAAKADNSNIPDSYEALYHKLLEQKQHFLDDRADSVRNLNDADSWLNQINKALVGNLLPINRQKLLLAKARMEDLKLHYHKDLDFEEEQLDVIERDLQWVEGEMKHFACMR